MDYFKNACRLHTDLAVHRYLMSNADGRWDGVEKALRHMELCRFYLCVATGHTDPDTVGVEYPELYKHLHDHTQQLTDYLDDVIGFPVSGSPDYDALAPKFFDKFHELALEALADLMKGNQS